MREVPTELQARLNSGATTLCRCWKVDRRDGEVMGFTDHDADIVFDGVTFRADSGMDASALQTATGLSVDNAQATGALRHAAISEKDIRAGRFDDAEVRQWVVDWRDVELRVLIFRGSFGEIRRADGVFEVELRGLAESLNAPVGRSILRSCDRRLGDGKCGVDTSDPAYSSEATLAAGSDATRLIVDGVEGYEPGWFQAGSLLWLTGENEGLQAQVKSDTVRQDGRRELRLWRRPPNAIGAGDRMRLVAGCDKSAETCRAKFANFLNFRGFPHIPGEDWVTAYPKSGDVHDGRSRQRP